MNSKEKEEVAILTTLNLLEVAVRSLDKHELPSRQLAAIFRAGVFMYDEFLRGTPYDQIAPAMQELIRADYKEAKKRARESQRRRSNKE